MRNTEFTSNGGITSSCEASQNNGIFRNRTVKLRNVVVTAHRVEALWQLKLTIPHIEYWNLGVRANSGRYESLYFIINNQKW
jgi:hypothetical protein